MGYICSCGFVAFAGFGMIGFLLVSITYFLGQFYWALSGYPSLFTSNPQARSSGAVSFLNAFFGGLVFGAWWNMCLTERRKGVSHYVFVVLLLVLGVSVGALFLMGILGAR